MSAAENISWFFALAPRDRMLFIWIVLTAPLRKLQLRTFNPHDLLFPAPPESALEAEKVRARELAILVDRAVGRTMRDDNCLVRSMVLDRVLADRDIPHVLRIGTESGRPFTKAHAWVEVGGIPVNDTAANTGRFVPFDPGGPS